MIRKQSIIPLFIMSLLLSHIFFPGSSAAEASLPDSATIRNLEVVQFQQQLNNMGFWIGPYDGLLSSQAYQKIMQFEMDANLVADGLIGLRIRQSPSLAAIDRASASALLAQTQDQAESIVPATVAQNEPVKIAEKSASAVSRGSSDSASARTGKVITMVATAYDASYECNQPYYGCPSYIGLPLERGIVATDPDVIPMGTRLYIEGYGEGIAADQGNAIKGNRIDLFFESHQEALDYGIKTVKVTILD